MIKGVRRPDEVSSLGLSHRLMVRVGALLKKNVAVSIAVLESARPGSALENLLLHPAVLERGGALDAAALAALPESAAAALAVAAAGDGMRVLCLQEELEAVDGWGAVPDGALQAPPSGGHALAIAPAPAPEARRDAGGVFSRGDLERWRLRLSTASAASERVEALRSLMLAPLTPAEKLEVLLEGLSDREAGVRAEAAGLLPVLGADRDVAEALSALNHAETARRMAAVDRLLKLMQHAMREAELGAVAVCAISTLRVENDEAHRARLLDLLRACAPAVGRSPARLAEVVRILTGLVAAAAKHGSSSREIETILNPAHRLMGALGAAEPKSLLPVLQAERERCSDPITEAFLLQLMLDLAPPGSEQDDALVALGAAYISRDTDEGRDSRAVGARLQRRGEKALLALCDVFASATSGAQKYILLLMDDICRARKLSPAALERAGGVLAQSVESGSKGLRMAAMHCRFAAEPELSEEMRARLAGAFFNSISDFVFPFDIDIVESTLARMGLPAIEPLMERLSPERNAPERVRAMRLLGEMALNIRAPKGQMARLQQAVTEALRRVQALSLDEKFPQRGELLCALGKLAACPAAAKDAGPVIERALFDGAINSDPAIAQRALEGLSWLAASRRAQAELVVRTVLLLRKLLDDGAAEIGLDSRRVNGETVIEITGGERYTTALPIVLKGLGRIAVSSSCPPATMRDIAAALLERWKKVCSAELVWGPTNSLLLIQALKEIACSQNLPLELRMEILKGFAPKFTQTAVMHALTEILASDDSSGTAVGALSIGHAILGRKGKDGQYAADDREEILKALTRLAARRLLGGAGDEARQKATGFRRMVVEELFKGLKDAVPHCYDALARLRDKSSLPPELVQEIERRLRDYHSLV